MLFWSKLNVGSNPLLVATLAAAGLMAAIGSYVLVFGEDNTIGSVVSIAPDAPLGQSSSYVPTLARSEPTVLSDAPSEKLSGTGETGGTPPPVAALSAKLTPPNLGGGSDISLSDVQDLAVPAKAVGDQVVASADTNDGAALDTSSAAIPAIGASATNLKSAGAPKFDLVRVDKYGAAVVAGKTKPGLKVQIIMNGDVIADTVADARGGFVALFEVPPTEEPQVLSLRSFSATGQATLSSDSVIVMGREVVTSQTVVDGNIISLTQDAPPAVIIATAEGIEVVQPAPISDQTPDLKANVSIDVISYDEAGEVHLTGRSTADKHVRVYVNDQPIKTEAVDPDGTWKLSLPEIEAGRYTLRVDEIDGAGQVVSRVETPFQKEQADDVLRTASAQPLGTGQNSENLPYIQKITVQPGATLWAMAQSKYGDGRLYLQIVRANRENIRNPDLIYPGQIFTIPD